MEPGRSVTLGPPQGTIESAPSTQTPSQAEHGLEGVFHFESGISRGKSLVKCINLPSSLVEILGQGPGYPGAIISINGKARILKGRNQRYPVPCKSVRGGR